jgi:hypothetical protein
MTGGIPVFIEQLGYGRPTIEPEVADPSREIARMPACHKPDPARLTGYASGVIACEPRPVFGQTVDVGCFCVGMPVAGQVSEPEIISEDENDIRFLISSGVGEQEYQ